MRNKIFNSALRHGKATSKGQAMAEFLVAGGVAMIITFVAIQFAVIARDSMALGQLSYQAARWAAAPSNSAADCDSVLDYIKTYSVAPQPVMAVINAAGITCDSGSGVVVTMVCPGGSCTARMQGSPVQIQLAMPITRDLFLGQSFFGVLFPNKVSNQTSALTQG